MSHRDAEDRPDPTGAEWDRQATAADDRNERDLQTEFERRMLIDDNLKAIGVSIERLQNEKRLLLKALRGAHSFISIGALGGSNASKRAAELIMDTLKECT